MRKTLLWTVTLSLAVLASYSNLLRAAAQSKKRITVPAGMRILIRTVDAIDSSKQKTGFRFTATLETNLQAEDKVIAPRGTTVYGRLAQASAAGRMSGSSELTLELTDIVINGTAYPLLTQARNHGRCRSFLCSLRDRQRIGGLQSLLQAQRHVFRTGRASV